MNVEQFLASGATAMTEGAVVERLARDPSIYIDPQILNGALIYDASAREKLASIHSEYIAAARAENMPILVFTDTWRCSRARLQLSAYRDRPVNEDNARFLLDLRASFGDGSPIFIGGQIGPSGDAYKPAEGLARAAARNFHWPQIEALAASGVDFLFLATAPSVNEALGAADAMGETGLPYLISFVIRRTGHVLDGTPLGAAMARLDAETARPPAGFAVNCVHARVLASALELYPDAARRLLTFQANTADREVEELDGSAELVSEPAGEFVAHVDDVRRRFGLRIVGGCCGTDGSHIAALAKRLRCEAATG